ncbi:hypothetical protein QVD17_18945 [Tagetes erecta]|uniref:NB-ARC domain-containing protein n=1 Tax=Tagetes erecta TaxID=13708 RepID=A0AAD8KJ14_TARER|nr:hypothetical protein QVD17_18945 [Tagetes erecta]
MLTYAGLQMFMEKLQQLITYNDNSMINNPTIIDERPQFQLLHEQLGSMIQTLFIDRHQELLDLEKLNDLKRRFMHAADEAQHIIDVFLSGVHIRNNGHSPTSEDLNGSLNLNDVRRSFTSVKVDFVSMRTDSMKIDSSRITDRTLNQSDAARISHNISTSVESNKMRDEIIVGIDDDVKLIKDKLMDNQKKLDVVSIVGMGGIGKTTLATKVFNDPSIMYHFGDVRVWVTVSKTYNKRDVFIQILESVRNQLELEKTNDSQLRIWVHQHLKDKRYLIVIDDIWHKETWDKVKLYFPKDNNGSRILLTSRLVEVAKHAKPDGLIHRLEYLKKEKGWELLCKKVFHGDECPEWLTEPGMQIVENCHGLPLSLVVIAGVLEKEAWSKTVWVEIAERTSSYIVGDENGCMEILALSYKYLPLHLRECFLYLGGFPEDHKFQVERLTSLWVAEGFIQQAGDRSLDDIAESYLMDLIDRNLVIVSYRRRSNRAVKGCTLHDLVRELCLRKAKEEELILKTLSPDLPYAITPLYKPVRLFINLPVFYTQFPENIRSILFFIDYRPLSDVIAGCFRSFMLLRVLDLQTCNLNNYPKYMELLVHLRYLAIWKSSVGFPASICNIWGLQTLIYKTRQNITVLPSNISDLVNLRHLWNYLPSSRDFRSFKMIFYLPSIDKEMNLKTISNVELGVGVDFQRCFPNVKELRCTIHANEKNDFESLKYLEKLKLTGYFEKVKSTGFDGATNRGKIHITLPKTLKALSLFGCHLPWSDMSIIQSLPNLEVLKLTCNGFEGSCWNAEEQVFQELKFLRLEILDIQQWKADEESFPSLRHLEIFNCKDLEEIPLDIGDIPTLELIKINNCRASLDESVRMIEEQQHDSGNVNLKVVFRR